MRYFFCGCLSLFLTSCCGFSVMPVGIQSPIYYPDSLPEECDVDLCELGEYGASYAQRGSYYAEEGLFLPEPGEPWNCYYERLIKTLAAQEHDICLLMEKIEESSERTKDLKHQEQEVCKKQQELQKIVAFSLQEAKQPYHGAVTLYTVQEGDTLCSIAQRRFGTKSGWMALWRLNRHQLLDGPHRIEVGQRLVIPNPSLYPFHKGA